MTKWHDKTDSLDTLIRDAAGSGHTPHSVSQSAETELKNRGYSDRHIDAFKQAAWRNQ